MKQSICLIYLPRILRPSKYLFPPPHLLSSPFRHFLYLLRAMFLIRQACLLKGKKKWIRKKILKQCEMTHRRVEGFWDIDNREEVLNGKNLQSPDNSIKEWWAGRGKNGIGLKGGGNWLIFLFRRHDREVGLHMSFQCRRTRTIPALNSVALELNSTVFAANL